MKEISDVYAPTVLRRSISERRAINACRGQSARQALGVLEPGCEIFGFTKGQFSLIHLLDAIVGQLSDCEVLICTWSTAEGDIQVMEQWLESGAVSDLRLIVDFWFPSRRAKTCDRLRELVGDDAIRVTVVHAKFITIKSGDWRLCLRTSMNLTHNPRFEHFDLSDDPVLFNFLQAIVSEVWVQQRAGRAFTQHPGSLRQDWERLFRPELALPARDARELLP